MGVMSSSEGSRGSSGSSGSGGPLASMFSAQESALYKKVAVDVIR